MNKSDLKLGARVSFSARHGEVIGFVSELDGATVVVTSDLDHSHRYRLSMTLVLTSKVTKLVN